MRVIEFAIAWKAGSEAGLACAHRVALAGYGEGGCTGAADVAGDEREIVDGGDGDCALRGVVDAHGPADEGGFGMAVEAGGSEDLLFGEPGNVGYVLGV